MLNQPPEILYNDINATSVETNTDVDWYVYFLFKAVWYGYGILWNELYECSIFAISFFEKQGLAKQTLALGHG